MIQKYFDINNPNSDYARKVIENNYLIDSYLDKSLSFEEIPENLIKESINLVILLQGKDKGSKRSCNWNCDICYTRDRFNQEGLNGGQLINLVNEVRKLGARGLYIPGIGEPTMSRAFWEYLRYESQGDRFPTLIFTNGSYIYDKSLQEEVGLTKEEMLKLVKENNLYQYIKFWTTDPKKAKKMYGVDIPYIKRKGINIPYSLDFLLNELPKEKVGIEIVIRTDNIKEVVEEIIPFANEEKLVCFIEQVIPVKWAPKVEIPEEKIEGLKELLAIYEGSAYCQNRAARDMVINIDTLSPCIVFPRLERYRVIEESGKIKNSNEIFKMFHDKSYRTIRKAFNEGGCACKKVLAGEIKWK
jgi:organic radical activating enzyme